MDKIEFTTTDGKKCNGYSFTWEGLSFGLTKEQAGCLNKWRVIELQSGCYVMNKRLPTRKDAVKQAVDFLNSKGIKVVKSRLREIFIERGNTKVKGKIKTVHFNLPDNMLKTLCGRAKDEYCLPVKYFKQARNPCKKCQRLFQDKKTS